MFVDEVSDPVVVHDFVVIFRLVQSHAQRGPRSAALGQENPDDSIVILVFKELLDHLIRFNGHFEHLCLLFSVSSASIFSIRVLIEKGVSTPLLKRILVTL